MMEMEVQLRSAPKLLSAKKSKSQKKTDKDFQRHTKQGESAGLMCQAEIQSVIFSADSLPLLQNVDLRNISMNEVRTLGKELREAGVLTAKQYMDFTTPWFGSVNIQTGEVVTGDTKLDYLAAFERVINFFKITDASDTETIANLENTQSLFLSLALQPA